MKKRFQKIACILLTVVMVLTSFPVSVFADDGFYAEMDASETESIDSGTDTGPLEEIPLALPENEDELNPDDAISLLLPVVATPPALVVPFTGGTATGFVDFTAFLDAQDAVDRALLGTAPAADAQTGAAGSGNLMPASTTLTYNNLNANTRASSSNNATSRPPTAFDGVRSWSFSNNSNTWTTQGATDHTNDNAKNMGVAVRFDALLTFDTVIVHAGRSGIQALRGDQTPTLSIETAAADVFNVLTTANNLGTWPEVGATGWTPFAEPFTLSAGQTNGYRVFVFSSTTPVMAESLRVNLPKVAGGINQPFINSVEVYNLGAPVTPTGPTLHSAGTVSHFVLGADTVVTATYNNNGYMFDSLEVDGVPLTASDFSSTTESDPDRTIVTFTAPWLNSRTPTEMDVVAFFSGGNEVRHTLTINTPAPTLVDSVNSYALDSGATVTAVYAHNHTLNIFDNLIADGVSLIEGNHPAGQFTREVDTPETGQTTIIFANAWLDAQTAGDLDIEAVFDNGHSEHRLTFTLTIREPQPTLENAVAIFREGSSAAVTAVFNRDGYAFEGLTLGGNPFTQFTATADNAADTVTITLNPAWLNAQSAPSNHVFAATFTGRSGTATVGGWNLSILPPAGDIGWGSVAAIPSATGVQRFPDFGGANGFLSTSLKPSMDEGYWGTAPDPIGPPPMHGSVGPENIAPVIDTSVTSSEMNQHFRQTSQGNASSSAFFAFNGNRPHTHATNGSQAWNTNGAGGQTLSETGYIGIAVDLLQGAPPNEPWPMADTVVIRAAFGNNALFAPSTATHRGIAQISIESGTTSAFGALGTENLAGPFLIPIQNDDSGLADLENESALLWRTVGDVATIEAGNGDRVFVFHLEEPVPMRYLRAVIHVEVPATNPQNLASQPGIQTFEVYNTHAGFSAPWPMPELTTDRYNVGSGDAVTAAYRENGFIFQRITVGGTELSSTQFSYSRDDGTLMITLAQAFVDSLAEGDHIVRAYFQGFGEALEHTLSIVSVVLQENATRVYEIGTESPVRLDFILNGSELAGVSIGGTAVSPANYTMAGTHNAQGIRTDRMNLIFNNAFLDTLSAGDITFTIEFVSGDVHFSVNHTITIRPRSAFRQRSFSLFSEFFAYANSPGNTLGIVPGYDFGSDPSMAYANNLGHAGVGAIFPSVIRYNDGANSTVTASSWANTVTAPWDNAPGVLSVARLFDGRRWHNIRQSSYMAWQVAGATDHQAQSGGMGKVTPLGAAMALDENTLIDTIVLYGGRAGINAFFEPDDANTGQAGIIGVGVYTSTNASDWNLLNFVPNPGVDSHWGNQDGSTWANFGAVIPVGGSDRPSAEVTERIFVFHSPVPVMARYIKFNVYRANNPRNPVANLQLQLGYSFEVYNTSQSLVSPNEIRHNLKDRANPLSTHVILRGGDTGFTVRYGGTVFTEGNQFTVAPGEHGNQIVSLTPAFLNTLGEDVITLTFTIGGRDFPVTIETFYGEEPGFAEGQAPFGSYDQTNPHVRPAIGLLLPDDNRVVSISRTHDGQMHDVAQTDHWHVHEEWVRIGTEVIEGNTVGIYQQTFTLEFTRTFLDALPVGVHNLRLVFAWGDVVPYLDYALTIERSHGAFLEVYTDTYNVRLPSVISVEYGAHGGYAFSGIRGLTQGSDFHVAGNIISFTPAFLHRFSRGVHTFAFLFTNDDSTIELDFALRIQPGSGIDYSIWELQTQEPDNPHAAAPLFHTYPSARLQRRQYSTWWYGDTEGDWDYFMTSPQGFTTANAASSRTELRELTPNADQAAWWYHRGYHSMRVEYKIEAIGLVSGPGSRSAIGQMKPNAGQMEIFVWNTGNQDAFGVTALPLGGGFPIIRNDAAAASFPAGVGSPIQLQQGETVAFTYRIIDSVATMYFDDSPTPFFEQNIARFRDNFYFKAGNYDQNSPRGWPDPDIVNSLVGISSIEVLHNPVRGRLVDANGNPWANVTLAYNLLDAPSAVPNAYGRTISGLTVTTDANGYFELTNIPNGRVSWVGATPQSVSRTAVVEIKLPIADGNMASVSGSGIGALGTNGMTFVIDAVPAHTIHGWREAATIVLDDILTLDIAPDTVAIIDETLTATVSVNGSASGQITLEHDLPEVVSVVVDESTIMITGIRPTSGQSAISGMFTIHVIRQGVRGTITVTVHLTPEDVTAPPPPPPPPPLPPPLPPNYPSTGSHDYGGWQTETLGSITQSTQIVQEILGNSDVSVRIRIQRNQAVPQLPTSTVNALINTATDNTVVLDLSDMDDISSVLLARSAVRRFADAEMALSIMLPQGIITFDANAVSSLGEVAPSNNITLAISHLDTEHLPPGFEMISIALSSGTQVINALDGYTTIAIPYGGALPVYVFFVNNEGNMMPIVAEFDIALQMTVFTVSELGVFVIGPHALAQVGEALTDDVPIDETFTDEMPMMRLTMGSLAYEVGGIADIADVAPFIYEDRAMVPLRMISEALGADVSWNEATRVATIIHNNVAITLPLDTPLPSGMGTPMIVNDRTFVPVRYVTEMLGANVRWDDENGAVYVYSFGLTL